MSSPAACSKELRHTPRQETVGVEGIPPPTPLRRDKAVASGSATVTAAGWTSSACAKTARAAMEDGTTATPRAAAVRSPSSQHLVEDLIQALMNGKVLCLLNAAG